MLEPRYGEDLTAKPFSRYARCQIGGQDLDYDFPPEIVILSHEDLRHAATNELALDGVRPAKGGKEAFGDRGHSGRKCGAIRAITY